MSDSHKRDSDPRLDDYVDGLLADAERAAFEERLADQPELRDALQRQRQVDHSLARLFSVPPSDRLSRRLDEQVADGAAHHSLPIRGRRRFLAVAAALALSMIAAWRLWTFYQPNPDDRYAPQPWRSLQTVYNDVLANGFEPDWVCEDDREFAGWFRRRLRQPLLLADSAAVRAGGLGMCNCITPNTMYLLARVAPDGTIADEDPDDVAKVIVFVDRARADEGQERPPDGPLNLFRGELGPFVLYELTPLSRPHVIDLFYQPKAGE